MSTDSKHEEVAKTVPPGQTTPAQPGSRIPVQLPAPFGRYRIDKLLGAGGMGSVYLAHDSQLDRSVALKIPLLESGDDSQILTRFYREARSAAGLHHPNICPIHEVGEVDGIPYLTMAFIEGKPLSEVLRSRPLAPRESAHLVRKLALALQEAHTRGVIHRDLKPANIMLDTRREPVIMDFGLALRTRLGDARQTQQGQIVGTPAYMAPEQASSDLGAIGPATDVYSLGVILYELLTGRLPFDSSDALTMLMHVIADEPPAPSKFRPDLDADLEAICLKAMAKKAPDRHGSMAELAAELTDYLRSTMTTPGQSGTQPAPSPRQSGSQPAPRTPKPKTEKEGIGESQMLAHSVAAFHRELAAPLPPASKPQKRSEKKIPGKRPPRRSRKRRSPLASGWVWIGGGVGTVLLLALLLWLAFRPSRFGTIKIELIPAVERAEITIDDEGGFHAGEVIWLKTGKHKIRVTAPKFKDDTRWVTVEPGRHQDELVGLFAESAEPNLKLPKDAEPAKTGFVLLKTLIPILEGADVWVEVDGERKASWKVGTTELKLTLPAGAHKIIARSIYRGEEWEFAVGEVLIDAGKTAEFTLGAGKKKQ